MLHGNRFLCQAVVVKSEGRLDVSLRTDASSSSSSGGGGDPAEAFIDKLSQALVALDMI